MRALLDTHALLWWLDGDSRLPARARKLIADEDTTVLVSGQAQAEHLPLVSIERVFEGYGVRRIW